MLHLLLAVRSTAVVLLVGNLRIIGHEIGNPGFPG